MNIVIIMMVSALSYFMQKYKPIITGVLTNESQWAEIMGNNYTGGSRHPLWYNNINEQSINTVLGGTN